MIKFDFIEWIFVIFSVVSVVKGGGLLLLYRPKDISHDCAFSQYLRYDISFGMGMSDTTTLVFRTLSKMDYQCLVEIVTESWAKMIIVMKFPLNLKVSCESNKDTITVLKKNKCIRICDLVTERELLSPYFVLVVNGRIRFSFLSNSSVNADIDASVYQVTATAARPSPARGCFVANETSCVVDNAHYCFTTGVVCDGINNCGVREWFDERKSDCGLAAERLGIAPVMAVMAAIFCALLAAGHILLRCLPPLANSFFIFNANEDNRLCIDPVFREPGSRPVSLEKDKKTSLIPISLSSSSTSTDEESRVIARTLQSLSISPEPSQPPEDFEVREEPVIPQARRKNTVRNIAQKIQNKFRKGIDKRTHVQDL